MEPDVRKRQIMIWYTVAAVIGILLFQQFWSSYSQIETIAYSEFERLLDQGKIAEVTVGTDTVQGSVKEPLPSGKREFFAIRVDPQLADKLAKHGVVVKGAPSGGLIQTILSWVVPAIIFYVIWMIVFRRFAEKQGIGGLMAVGKSRAKVYVETDTKVTFKDVAGVEEAKFVRPPGRKSAEGHSSGRASRNRKDALGACGRGGGRCAILLDLRLRVCRNVCRRWRRPGA